MADSFVNSPIRMLSLSKERATVSLLDLDSDENVSEYPVSSEEQGPKSFEIYVFAGSITTVVTTAIYLIWAYTPEPCLYSLGITYYPSRYWALSLPAFAMVAVVLAMVFYIGLNFMVTPLPTSLNTMFDVHCRERSMFVASGKGEVQPIEPISDISISQINDLMFR
ncbi:phosphatidylinositol N-acetylglucosaminyltransferase subunit P-like isoform X4 [Tasmannia lanceolata]|uniref:phosphatidylinositol N-acetylglucosaminyltransferase subunit P-like isoform X4 n=1 Tax=Tasmannia lanceolata TaxID=3420 RepID=UPI0040644E35